MPHDVDRNGRPPYPYRALPPGPAAAQAARARRILVACAVAITAGVAGLMALIYPSGQDGPAPVAQEIVEPSPLEWEPSAPVSMLPAPASSSTATPTTPAAASTATRRPAPTGVSRTVSPAPVVDLDIGATVGLSVAGRADLRLRHRDFVGRIDRIVASSSALERADSRFVVRKGLGREGCVSLESVNYPGYFLRHRNFILRLERPGRWDRRGGSELFERDATFCTTPTHDGAAFVLESINYPGRALSVRDDGVVGLDEDDPTAFVVRSPL
ncbi:AbfB domain-containing protein [Actinoplanes sp. NPDC051513]|uniref:AbfB domain-containing protein n=1 Tax=Actinoplanes sp. NPDC051513 TaxID=3363908 RepID=UPI00379B8118